MMLSLTTALCCRISSGLTYVIYTSISVLCNLCLSPSDVSTQRSSKEGLFFWADVDILIILDVLSKNGYGGQWVYYNNPIFCC